MNKILKLPIVCLLWCLVSCVTEVDLKFPVAPEKIVIEGLITDEPYDYEFWSKYKMESTGNYVRLTYSNPLNIYAPGTLASDSIHYARDMAKYVRNALVVIHDDLGKSDTLKPDSAQSEPFRGYYTNRKLIGVAGRTYFLDVWVNNQHYSAHSYMEPVPSLDSVDTDYIKRPIDKFSGYSPLFYFHNSSKDTQYYLTKVTSVPTYTDVPEENLPPFPHFNGGSGSGWQYSIVSSEFLPEYVKGLSVTLAQTTSTYDVAYLELGNTYDGCLFSLSKEAYEYYGVLIKTFQNDGGAYSPAPASPPTNIKGGALGFFNVSSGSIKRFTVK